jgi:diguanylate cyclase (GGDEF)-like protein/PAS domain S-box-containing protein
MHTDRPVAERSVPTVLLADDDVVTRTALTAQLEGEFAIVACAEDAAGAIELAGRHRPDIALVDVAMPGGGLQATFGIRQLSPETAIVIMTADESRSSVLQFLDAGATAYLRKGTPLHQLTALINRALTTHRALSERAERVHRAAKDGFRAAFDQAALGMAIVLLEGPEAGQLVAANAAYALMLGRERSDLIGANPEQWTHPDDLPDGATDPLSSLAREQLEGVEFEQRYLHVDGRVIHTLGTAACFVDEDARRVAIVQVLDISERKRFEERLAHLADHDALTGLLNRRRLQEEIVNELARVHRYGSHGALLALDFDGFKVVNDTLGHAAGDELVIALGAAIESTLRLTDVVARTGGDEFVVILPEATEEAALLVAEKLLDEIRIRGVVSRQDQHVRVTTSIGIATFDQHDHVTADDLLVEADIAMYDAKAAGRDRCCAYVRDAHRRERIAVRQGSLDRLRTAVEHQQFVLHAQPIVAVCSNGVPRFELLLRMTGEHGELILPGDFLYNAERFGLIGQIDCWVMSEAVRILHESHRSGRDLSLAINVSGTTLNDGAITQHLAILLETYPIPAGRLVIELTETVAISNGERARALTSDIRALGCRLALDDFGAGFATFYHLKHLQFDYVKIDREFVKALTTTRADQLVVAAVVDIARGLGADTIAEFVQDDETLAVLRELGVGYAQGYHLGRPGPLDLVLPPIGTGQPPAGAPLRHMA